MENKQVIKTKNLILVALFTALIIVGTFIRVPIPVLPFTLQFLFTNLAGLLLGKRMGAVSVLIYIIMGLLGIPVFTSGGGMGYIFQPTFGYIPGFMFGAWLAGYVVERSNTKNIKTYLAASFANLAVVYTMGMLYYFFISNYYLKSPIGIGALFLYCFVLAIPGDILLCFLSSVLARRLHNIVIKN